MMGMTSAQLISEYYGKYQNEIAMGMIGSATMGMFYTPWSLLLATMLRDEDGSLGVPSVLICCSHFCTNTNRFSPGFLDLNSIRRSQGID